MRLNWNNAGRTPTDRAKARLRAQGSATPLRRRIDLPLLIFLTLALIIVGLLWIGGWYLSDRSGLLDPPAVQPLATNACARMSVIR